jgi:ParB family chromosome partitioning protein
MAGKNHVELDWAVDQIQVGVRHRKDLGDIDALAASIGEYGLLAPLTITEQGVLICGRRRLEAIRLLGWKIVNVWVRVDLSEKLSGLMAEREDQVNVKPYTVTEMAALYEELKAEITADAARRQQASRFGGDEGDPADATSCHSLSDGAGNFPAPVNGRARDQAAGMVGGVSHKTMDKIVELRATAADATRSDDIRTRAADALKAVEAGEPVDPFFLAVRSRVRLDDLERIAADDSECDAAQDAARSGIILLRKLEATAAMTPADLDKAAQMTLARVKAARPSGKTGKPRPEPKPPAPVMRSAKWFTYTWKDLAGWTNHVDPNLIAASVADQDWDRFKNTITESVTFMNTVDRLRDNTT